jgi:hypothetical protein
MTKPMIRIHNITTNEVIDREMNEAEYANYLAQAEAIATETAEAEAKATARTSALAKLAELGLTADEIASL